MDLAKISLQQVFIMFIMIILGFVLVKAKIIEISSKKSLSNLLVYLVVPFMIVSSYCKDYDKEIMTNILWCFLASFIVLIVGILIVFILTLIWKIDDKPILRFGMMFSNAAYMGFPLIEAMFGDTGLIYASCFVSIFNILLWTIGYMVVSRCFSPKVAIKSILKTPVIYSLIIGIIIFFFQIPVPNIIKSPLSMIGSMNTPISMIITGMIIASSNVIGVLKNKFLWFTTTIRLLIIPFASLLIVYLLSLAGVDSEVLKIIFILEACPCAAITSIFAIKFQYNEDLACGAVVVTTLLSIITLPAFTLLIEQIF